MAFDLSTLDLGAKSNAGAPMEIAKDENGDPVTITLLGRASKKVRDKNREIQLRRVEAASNNGGKVKPSFERFDAEEAEILVAATVGWTISELDGQPFPFSEQNARRLWGDLRFIHIREQAIAFINNDAGFLPG